MAQVSHIQTPAVRCPCSSPHHTPTQHLWNPDSDATSHMTPNLKWLRHIVNVHIAVSLTNNEVVWVTKMGQVWFTPMINGRTGCTLVFTNVLYVPELQNNLFSILTVVWNSKMQVVIEGEMLWFYSKDRELLLTASIEGTTGRLDGVTLDNTVEAFLSQTVERELLHQRLGHIGKDRLRTLLKQNLATGIAIKAGSKMKDICVDCLAGKQHRDPFPNLVSNCSHELLGHIHSDLHGLLQTQTPSGFRYWITFQDDYSRYKEVHLLKRKSNAFPEFNAHVTTTHAAIVLPITALVQHCTGSAQHVPYALPSFFHSQTFFCSHSD